MSNAQKKAILFAPFWRQPGHVGNNRVDRFVRWLAEDGYDIVMIRAGRADAIRQESWGREITVRDRLGLYNDIEPGDVATASPRNPNKFRRALAYWLFNPDPTVVWAKAAARHPAVLQATQGGDFILSSSPPESAHLGAWLLSRQTAVPQVVDMRDGWLDEPLKPFLRNPTLRRWLERRMEARILRDARAIQVTSDVWKELLCRRLPELTAKVHVLTNGYPENILEVVSPQPNEANAERVLIHAGRFTGSRLTQYPGLLLEPLLQNISLQSAKGVVQLIGSLSVEELDAIELFKPRFKAIGWRIECPGSMPRQALLELLPKADGLLLLSASHAAIPSKLFEYIPTGRPMFVVTERGGATWQICEPLAQASLIDTTGVNGKQHTGAATPFYLRFGADIPEAFTEKTLAGKFRAILA